MTTEPSIRVTLTIPPGANPAEIAARLVRPNETMRAALDRGMKTLLFTAQKERFTGQGPFPVSERRLGVVSGRLRRDLYSKPVAITANGYAGAMGSAVEYFAPHEFGFSGTVAVPAHRRGPYTVSARGYRVPEHSVRAHARRVNIPARAPLSTAIIQHSQRVLSAAVKQALATP